MRILLLGRKHIAKSEPIARALRTVGHSVDSVFFPAFSYLQGDAVCESSFSSVPFKVYTFKIGYYIDATYKILSLLLKNARTKDYDLFFAIDWFEACLLLVFRFFSRKKVKVLFYSYDYPLYTTAFSFRFLISLLDRFAVRHSDVVWNVSESLQKVREQHGLFSSNQKTVPLGIEDAGIFWEPKREKHFLFVGSFKEGHNILKLIHVFSTLVQEDVRYQLTFVGQGTLFQSAQELVQKMHLEKNICFRGFVSTEVLQGEIAQGIYTCGVALYENIPALLCQDPGKIKDYLAWQMPVVTTGYHFGSAILREYNLGYVASNDDEETLRKCFEGVTCDDVRLKQRLIAQYIREQSFEKVLSWHLFPLKEILVGKN